MRTFQASAAVVQHAPPTAVTAASAPRRGSEYAVLLRQVKQAGLLDRRTGHYMWRTAVTTVLLAGGWLAFVPIGESWWQLAVAVFLAIVFAQVGFLAHDAGHKQIFTSRRANDIAGILLGNLGVGLDYGFWVDNHNRHHVHPNTDGKDPDIDFGALAFTPGRPAVAAGRPTGLPLPGVLLLPAAPADRAEPARGQCRVPHPPDPAQPHLETGAVRRPRRRLPRGGVLGALPGQGRMFIGVQQGLLGLYLGVSFAPNHKGMPILDAADNRDFLRRQVLTSRNIRGGPLVDAALGALNYQIEHHLFPSMPRPNLRRAQPIIARFCRQHGPACVQTSLLNSYARTLHHLNDVGRNPQPTSP